jgi:UMF1 family MFS transporter
MNRRIVWAWCMYDWANSAYPLVISTALFPVYFSLIAPDRADSTVVTLAGIQWESASLYSLAIAISYAVCAVLVPVLSGIADWGHRRKMFLRVFCTMGAASCMLLALTSRELLGLGLAAAAMASIGFNGSLVFYNAFLPEIAPPRLHDRISARGYIFGYVGSSLLLVAILAAMLVLSNWHSDGTGETAFRIVAPWAFVAVGLWWYGFAQITLRVVPEQRTSSRTRLRIAITRGIEELRTGWQVASRSLVVRLFLASYVAASMGVQSVIMLASVYGKQELGLGESLLVGIILVVQFVAAIGSWLCSRLSEWLGNTRALIMIALVWTLVCAAASVITTASAFVALSAAVGLVLGGIQSQMRSTFSKLIASEPQHTSLFSLYDIAEKIGTTAGMGMFSLAVALTRSLRIGAMVLGVAFVLATALLWGVHRRARSTDRWRVITEPRLAR